MKLLNVSLQSVNECIERPVEYRDILSFKALYTQTQELCGKILTNTQKKRKRYIQRIQKAFFVAVKKEYASLSETIELQINYIVKNFREELQQKSHKILYALSRDLYAEHLDTLRLEELQSKINKALDEVIEQFHQVPLVVYLPDKYCELINTVSTEWKQARTIDFVVKPSSELSSYPQIKTDHGLFEVNWSDEFEALFKVYTQNSFAW
jgi:hypothetical protein